MTLNGGNGHCEGDLDLAARQHAIAEDRAAAMEFLRSADGFDHWEKQFYVSLADGDSVDERAMLIELAAQRLFESTPPTVYGDISSWALEWGRILAVDEDVVQRHIGAAQRKAKPYIQRSPVVEDPHWPRLDEAALYGLAGDVVRTIEPHIETHPIALLLQFLAAFGNVTGRGAFYQVGRTRHYPSLFAVLVGDTAKAGKGTSWDYVKDIIKEVDEEWSDDRVQGGLSSGEGLIHAVRDKVIDWDADKDQEKVIDSGSPDKRLLVIEPEFSSVLAQAERPGNILSQLIRCAWDGKKLQTMTKNSPMKASFAHISLIGHVTGDELRARLTRTDMVNGFCNRLLLVMVRRERFLPFRGDLSDDDIRRLGERTAEAVKAARYDVRVTMSDAAKTHWVRVYRELSEGQAGLLGAITARAAPQVARLALIYALLDSVKIIDLPHLKAALAVWNYCEQSANYIFGDTVGDPTADDTLRAIRQAGNTGLSQSYILRDLFGAIGRPTASRSP
jgi:hypothetical protein